MTPPPPRRLLRVLTLPLWLLAPACQTASPPAAAAPAAPPEATSARAAWVHPRPAEGALVLEAPATVLAAPEARAAVAAPFSARVVRVRVRPGEKVEKGQVLLDVLMPEVVRAAGGSVAASLRVEAYGKQRTQLAALQEKGMARLAEVAEAETRLAEARADLQAASAVLRVAGLSPQEASEVARTGNVGLRSPIAGTVVEVHASLGEVAGGEGPPLVRVAAPAAEVRIEARLSRPPPPRARFEYVPPVGAPLPLRAVGLAPQVDARDATTTAWFEPEEAGAPALAAGQSGRVRVHAGPQEGVLLVPSRALTFHEGKPHVLLREGATAQPREVQVLMLSGAEALVQAAGLDGEAEVAADAAPFEATGEGGHHD